MKYTDIAVVGQVYNLHTFMLHKRFWNEPVVLLEVLPDHRLLVESMLTNKKLNVRRHSITKWMHRLSPEKFVLFARGPKPSPNGDVK